MAEEKKSSKLSRRDALKYLGVGGAATAASYFGVRGLLEGGSLQAQLTSNIASLEQEKADFEKQIAELGPRPGFEPRFGLESTLTVLNWYDYIAPGMIQGLKAYGVDIDYRTYNSVDETFQNIVSTRGSGIDLLVLPDYLVPGLQSEDLLEPLERDRLPNSKTLKSDFSLGQYAAPYFTGLTGIAYRKLDGVTLPAEEWAAIFDPAEAIKYTGQIAVLDDSREVFGAALAYLGFDPNDEDPGRIEQAFNLLQAIRRHVVIDSAGVKGNLAQGQYKIAMAYNTDAFQAMWLQATPNLDFKVPSPMATRWVDVMVRLKGEGKHPNASHWWIDNMLAPQSQAVNANYLWVGSPNSLSTTRWTTESGFPYPWIYDFPDLFIPWMDNSASLDIPFTLLRNKAITPTIDSATLQRLRWLRPYQSRATEQLISQKWAQFKGS